MSGRNLGGPVLQQDHATEHQLELSAGAYPSYGGACAPRRLAVRPLRLPMPAQAQAGYAVTGAGDDFRKLPVLLRGEAESASGPLALSSSARSCNDAALEPATGRSPPPLCDRARI